LAPVRSYWTIVRFRVVSEEKFVNVLQPIQYLLFPSIIHMTSFLCVSQRMKGPWIT